MNELVYRIKTLADVKGLEDLKRSLTAGVQQMKLMGGDATHLEAQLRAVDAALNSQAAAAARSAASLTAAIKQTKALGGDTAALKQQLREVSMAHGLQMPGLISRGAAVMGDAFSEIPGVGAVSRMLSGGKGLVGLGAAGVGGAVKSIAEFGQAQDVWAGVDAALAQTQQLTDANREAINQYAGELQKLTGISDETWASVMGDVVQFGGRVENIQKHTDAVKNYAGLLKGDVAAASEGYRKALAGNFMAFARLGFEVDKHASQTENLARLWEFLGQRGGGQLEARAKTLSGQWQLLKNNVGDVFEAFGRMIAGSGALQNILWALGTTAGWMAEKLGGVPPKLEGLANAQARTIQTSEDAASAAEGHASAISKVKDASEDAAKALDAQREAAQRLADYEDKLADIEMSIQLEQLKGRKDLSAPQKLAEEKRIRAAAEQRKIEAQMTAAQEEIGRQKDTVDKAGAARDAAQGRVEAQEQRVQDAREMDHARRVRKDASDKVTEAEASLQGLLRQRDEQQGILVPEDQRVTDQQIAQARLRQAKALEELAAANKRIGGLSGRYAPGKLPDDVVKEEAALAKRTAEADKANRDFNTATVNAAPVITGKTEELGRLGKLREKTGVKLTLEAQNALREQISKSTSPTERADALIEGLRSGLDPREVQAGFRDMLGQFQGTSAERQKFMADIQRRYAAARRQPRSIVPPPGVSTQPAARPEPELQPPQITMPSAAKEAAFAAQWERELYPGKEAAFAAQWERQLYPDLPQRNVAPEVNRVAQGVSQALDRVGTRIESAMGGIAASAAALARRVAVLEEQTRNARDRRP